MALDLAVKPPKPTPDPFAAMGGGVQLPGGGWAPANHPDAAAAPPPPQTDTPTAAPPAPTPDPFQGNGVQLATGQWVPKDHPLAQGANAPASPAQVQGVFSQALMDELSMPPAAPASPDPFAAQGGGVQLPNGGWAPANHPDAPPQPLPAPTVPETTPVTTPATAEPDPNADITQALHDAIVSMLKPGEMGDMADDPRAAAFRVAQKRSYDRARAQAAESAAQSGMTGTGGFEGAMRGLEQSRGESEAAYEAGLVGEELNARRTQLTQALGLAQSMGDRDAQIQLQRELAQLNAQVQREGYGVTTRGQDVQKYGIDTSAMLDRLQQELQRYGLDLNDARTRDALGFDYTKLQAMMNEAAAMKGLDY
jgi:hypothetical protein